MKIFHIIISYRFSYFFLNRFSTLLRYFQRYRFLRSHFLEHSSKISLRKIIWKLFLSFSQQLKKGNLLFRKWHYPFLLFLFRPTAQINKTPCQIFICILEPSWLQRKQRPWAIRQGEKGFREDYSTYIKIFTLTVFHNPFFTKQGFFINREGLIHAQAFNFHKPQFFFIKIYNKTAGYLETSPTTHISVRNDLCLMIVIQ